MKLLKLWLWIKQKFNRLGSKSACSDLLFCDDCKFLSPKELKQTSKKEPHMCLLNQMPVMHAGHHPRLPKPWYIKYCIAN